MDTLPFPSEALQRRCSRVHNSLQPHPDGAAHRLQHYLHDAAEEKEIVNSLGQENLPFTFDMGLLTKALEICWARPQELSGVIPCEGGMHLLISVLAGIGHLYGSAGLEDLLHRSGVFAKGTTQQILRGSDVSRGMYALKVIDETLHNQFYHAFDSWYDEEGMHLPLKIRDQLEELQSKMESQNIQTDNICAKLDSLAQLVEEHLVPQIDRFREEGRTASDICFLG